MTVSRLSNLVTECSCPI